MRRNLLEAGTIAQILEEVVARSIPNYHHGLAESESDPVKREGPAVRSVGPVPAPALFTSLDLTRTTSPKTLTRPAFRDQFLQGCRSHCPLR